VAQYDDSSTSHICKSTVKYASELVLFSHIYCFEIVSTLFCFLHLPSDFHSIVFEYSLSVSLKYVLSTQDTNHVHQPLRFHSNAAR